MASLPVWAALLLLAFVFVVAVWNTAVGSTGGLVYATLAVAVSPAAAIPIQAVMEGVSGSCRTWMLRRCVSFEFMAPFAAGGLIGVAAGTALLASIGPTSGSDRLLRIVVAAFILSVTWLPLARSLGQHRAAPAFVGGTTTFLSMFVGGMGAAVGAAVESRGEVHSTVLATQSAALVFQYGMRLAVFGLLGFTYSEYLPLIVSLTLASIAGTLLGGQLLLTIDPDRARRIFRWVVTAIAASMIVRSV